MNLSRSEMEIITSLVLSYFLASEIFGIARVTNKEEAGLVERNLVGEKLIFSIIQSNAAGFSFNEVVSDKIRASAGKLLIAKSIESLLHDLEKEINQ